MVAPLKTEASEVVNVLIGKEGADHVRIKIALPPVDRHNVEAQVYIISGPFLGAFRSFFAIQELAALGKDVEVFSKTLSRAVSLTPLEHSLNFKMEHRGLGHIQVQGYARPDLVRNTDLYFDFQIDQTFLPRIIGDLAPILDLARS
jgi:hypothetical protein